PNFSSTCLFDVNLSSASFDSSTRGQGSSPRQPSGGAGALAAISLTILPSLSFNVSPSSTSATVAFSGSDNMQFAPGASAEYALGAAARMSANAKSNKGIAL